ncbi:hypothetical protein [Microbacterium sp. YJN-G]|uniref:hypothetical protein n=1 Tax=Microbacterium sp. YJN-G TaxID=2763257 RepID=UPI0018784073|nr:hypothetical protein [Microbacterium sp. YJN-G]
MITSTLAMPLIALSTLATIIFIGLGFLPRPSRATALWSAAFAVAMVGSYVWLAQGFTPFPQQLRALGSALTIAPMPLIWSGLRAYRGLRRQYVALSVAVVVILPAFLLTAVALGIYPISFRIAFASLAVFAVLIFLDLMKLGPQLRDEALPLIGVSAAYVVFSAITIINAAFQASGEIQPADSLQFIRTLNLIGVNVYITCALITLLLLTTRSGVNPSPHRDFERIVRNRLNRAQAAEDQWWALLDIRLDDPDEIRLATSASAFNAVSEKFARDIDSVFPADADIERMNASRFLVLVPRPQGGVRDLVTELLERVSAPLGAQPMQLRLSASIGWAPVSVAGYGFDELVNSAAQAALTASAKGGDRWERIRGSGE